MRKLFVGLVALLGIAVIIPVAVIALSAPKSPPAMISMAAPFRQIRLENIPTPQHFQARDGVSLQYYAYPPGPIKLPYWSMAPSVPEGNARGVVGIE